MRKRNAFIALIVLFGVVITGIFLFVPVVNHIGKMELYNFAKDKNYCRSENCDEGIAYVTELLHKQSGIPSEDVPWCMATNRFYYADLHFLNALKMKFTDWMYKGCERDELTLDDAHIEIKDHHHDHDD